VAEACCPLASCGGGRDGSIWANIAMSVLPSVDRIGSILPVSRHDHAQYPADQDGQPGRRQPLVDAIPQLKPKSTPTENAQAKTPDTTRGQIVNTFALLGSRLV